jgi:hypothetical protein
MFDESLLPIRYDALRAVAATCRKMFGMDDEIARFRVREQDEFEYPC